MATFKYKNTWLEWEPDRGYHNPVTGEWSLSPVEAVESYVDKLPDEREDWVDLVRLIQGFWTANVTENVAGIEEVRFDSC